MALDATPLKYASTTTLNLIRAASPCHECWTKLLKHLGKSKADDDLLELLTVLDSNGLDDALWVLSYGAPGCERLARHFQAWCAEQVLPVFEAAHPNDARVRDQISMLRNDDADDAARDAAWAAAWNAARAAAGDAAWDAARAAAWDAAWAAAGAAARAAAWAAAWDAARAAAWDAAWDAARAAQERQLRKMLAGVA